MGGTGALQLAFNHPQVFGVVGANSPSLFESLEKAPYYFGDSAYYASYDPLNLAEAQESIRALKIWVDVGDGDPWLDVTRRLHSTLTARGIDHQWNVFPGVHFTTYWQEHTPKYLEFYSRALGN